MNAILRGACLTAALIALNGPTAASDETVNAGLLAGMTANQVAQEFANNWSKFGGSSCSVNLNTLTVFDNSGDCTLPVSKYTFTVTGGTLAVNHSSALKITCEGGGGAAPSSLGPGFPLVASFELDGGGFVPLVPGPNPFVSGPDTITIGFVNTAGPLPTMPQWGLVVLVTLTLTAGGVLLHRRTKVTA